METGEKWVCGRAERSVRFPRASGRVGAVLGTGLCPAGAFLVVFGSLGVFPFSRNNEDGSGSSSQISNHILQFVEVLDIVSLEEKVGKSVTFQARGLSLAGLLRKCAFVGKETQTTLSTTRFFLGNALYAAEP